MNNFKKHKLATVIGILCLSANVSAFDADNLVTNGDFESELDGSIWLPAVKNPVVARFLDPDLSSQVAHISSRKKYSSTIKQIVALVPGKIYNISGQAKSTELVGFTWSYQPVGGGNTSSTLELFNSAGAWVDINSTFTVPVDDVDPLGDFKIWVLTGQKDADGNDYPVNDLYLDNIVLVEVFDDDGDGVINDDDAFLNDPAASLDTDEDGYPDSWIDGKSQADSTSDPVLELDSFPNDAAAYLDTDGDGMPDSWNEGKSQADSTSDPILELDLFPNDPTNGETDSDLDGISDKDDSFPNDIAAFLDTDNDGFPDSWTEGKTQADSTSDPVLELDVFPNDAAAALDTDGDGYPDSWNEGMSANDSTSDPVLEKDSFPDDAAAYLDTDGDGFPNSWNEGKSQADSTSDPVLMIDAFPDDSTETVDTDGDGVGDNADPYPLDPFDGVIQAGSKLSKPDSYENRGEKDYWTAFDILEERLDIMRFQVSSSLNLLADQQLGQADYEQVDAWLADNPEWHWSTPEQFEAIHSFFDSIVVQENIDAFLQLTGDEWSTWSRPGKPSKWLVLTKDTSADDQSEMPMLKYTVTQDVFNIVATATDYNLKKVEAAAVLVRTIDYDPYADDDGDGVINIDDAFINDPLEWSDSDGDGVGDNSDVFPNDPTESGDADGDGIGDNADLDADNDGVLNTEDGFPLDNEQSIAIIVEGALEATEGEALNLDATASALGEAQLTYSWTQISGTDVNISSIDAKLAIDVLPNVDVDEELVFELTVSNGVHTAIENVSFMLKAIPSFVSVQASLIGGQQVEDATGGMITLIKPGSTIALDGSNASDTLEANLTYQWVQTRGPLIELINANQANASFEVPSGAKDVKVGFRLTVSNGQAHEGATAVSMVSAEIDKKSDSGGSIGIWTLLLAGITLFKRKKL